MNSIKLVLLCGVIFITLSHIAAQNPFLQQPQYTYIQQPYANYMHGSPQTTIYGQYPGSYQTGGIQNQPPPKQLNVNPLILGGSLSNPSIRFRINQSTFQYISLLLYKFIVKTVSNLRIPQVTQQIPQLSGSVSLYNMYISNFKPPSRVQIYPSPPNTLNLIIENIDISVTGNLDGVIKLLVPISLNGFIYAGITGAGFSLSLSFDAEPNGAIKINVCHCGITQRTIDLSIECGGLLGNIANTIMKNFLIDRLKSMLSTQICDRVKQVGPTISSRLPLPKDIALGSFLSQFVNKMVPKQPDYCNHELCRASQYKMPSRSEASKAAADPNSKFSGRSNVVNARRSVATVRNRNLRRNKRQFGHQNVIYVQVPSQPYSAVMPSPGIDCSACKKKEDTFGSLILSQLNFDKIYDIMLLIRAQFIYSTNTNFGIDLNAFFFQYRFGYVPFGPLPMQFPLSHRPQMFEILISDTIVNSLFHLLHKNRFGTIQIGSDFPTVGKLLMTTCDSDSDEFDELLGENGSNASVRHTVRALVWKHVRKQRTRRQALGGLADAGICIGDIIPSLGEKYPNKPLTLLIYTGRPPSVLFTTEGLVVIDIVLNVDFYLADRSMKRIGVLTLAAALELKPRLAGNQLFLNASIARLNMTDSTGGLNLPQDQWDNLANLIKDVAAQGISSQTSKPIPLPLENIPLGIINLNSYIFPRTLYLAFDINLPMSILSQFTGDLGF